MKAEQRNRIDFLDSMFDLKYLLSFEKVGRCPQNEIKKKLQITFLFVLISEFLAKVLFFCPQPF